MKKRRIKVAVVVLDAKRMMPPLRQHGWWSYPVPEFDFEYYPVDKHQNLDKEKLKDFDIIYHEDNKCYPKWRGNGPPIMYKVSDSDLSRDHYRSRHKYLERFPPDIILVDKDDLDRFSDIAPAYRFSYCVNDHIFHDYFGWDKEIDVGYHCKNGNNPEKENKRRKVRNLLRDVCERNDLVFSGATGPRYKYAKYFSRDKISVDTIFYSRNQRFMDSMACRTCVLSEEPKSLEGEDFVAGKHYIKFDDPESLGPLILDLLESERWKEVAEQGYRYIHKHHNWKARAKYLYDLILEEGFIQ